MSHQYLPPSTTPSIHSTHNTYYPITTYHPLLPHQYIPPSTTPSILSTRNTYYPITTYHPLLPIISCLAASGIVHRHHRGRVTEQHRRCAERGAETHCAGARGLRVIIIVIVIDSLVSCLELLPQLRTEASQRDHTSTTPVLMHGVTLRYTL